jgi:hypothetical protein
VYPPSPECEEVEEEIIIIMPLYKVPQQKRGTIHIHVRVCPISCNSIKSQKRKRNKKFFNAAVKL